MAASGMTELQWNNMMIEQQNAIKRLQQPEVQALQLKVEENKVVSADNAISINQVCNVIDNYF